MTKILILGGIREANELTSRLVSEGHEVTTSLAGRTKEPNPVEGKVRIGGFGGASGLSEYLREQQIELLIDCTHPFAKQITKNAKQAAKITGIELKTITRKPWHQHPNDNWIKVANLEDARDVIPKDARVLLALGRQHINLFQTRKDVHFVVRMVDVPEEQLPLPSHECIFGTPSTNPVDERALLKSYNITHIVCRNSGGLGAFAKIEAARGLGMPIIMISRQECPHE